MKKPFRIKDNLPAAAAFFGALLLLILWGMRYAHDQKVMSALTDFRKTISSDLSEFMSQDNYISGAQLQITSAGSVSGREIADLMIYVNSDYDLLPPAGQIRLADEWAAAAGAYYRKRFNELKYSELFGGRGAAKYKGKTIYIEDYIPRLYTHSPDIQSPDRTYHLYRYASSKAEHVFFAGNTEYTGADYPEMFGVSQKELEEYRKKNAPKERGEKKTHYSTDYSSSDFYGSEDYESAEDFADDWADEFDEDFDEGWDEAYEYWMEQHGE